MINIIPEANRNFLDQDSLSLPIIITTSILEQPSNTQIHTHIQKYNLKIITQNKVKYLKVYTSLKRTETKNKRDM